MTKPGIKHPGSVNRNGFKKSMMKSPKVSHVLSTVKPIFLPTVNNSAV
jgi:hypothetical protein